MTTLVLWLAVLAVVAVLFGLTALAFRGGNPSIRSMDASARGDARGGDQVSKITRNRFNELWPRAASARADPGPR
jgi:hypothetical protein